MPTYAYLRLSTDEKKQSSSFEVQRTVIDEFANKNDLEPIKEYYQDSKSGAELEKRKGLMQLLNTIKRNDRVIVQKIDRLARDPMLHGWIRTEITRKGAELFIVDAEVNTDDPYAEMMETIISAFANFERKMIKSRIQSTLNLKKENGEKLGGYVPYGYDVIEQDEKKVLIKNEAEQKVIRAIKRYSRDGMSLRGIASRLTERNIFTKSGKEFTHRQVKRILEYKHNSKVS